MVWLEVNAFIGHCNHTIDFDQRQNTLYSELTLKTELFGKALYTSFVKLDFGIASSALVV